MSGYRGQMYGARASRLTSQGPLLLSVRGDAKAWFEDIGATPDFVRNCGHSKDKVVCLDVWEDTTGDYHGWLDAGDPQPSMVYRHERMRDLCFPYGAKAEEDAGKGRRVRLRCQERERLNSWPVRSMETSVLMALAGRMMQSSYLPGLFEPPFSRRPSQTVAFDNECAASLGEGQNLFKFAPVDVDRLMGKMRDAQGPTFIIDSYLASQISRALGVSYSIDRIAALASASKKEPGPSPLTISRAAPHAPFAHLWRGPLCRK